MNIEKNLEDDDSNAIPLEMLLNAQPPSIDTTNWRHWKWPSGSFTIG